MPKNEKLYLRIDGELKAKFLKLISQLPPDQFSRTITYTDFMTQKIAEFVKEHEEKLPPLR